MTYIGKPIVVRVSVGQRILMDGVSEFVYENVVRVAVGIVRCAHKVVIQARGSFSTQASQ